MNELYSEGQQGIEALLIGSGGKGEVAMGSAGVGGTF